MSEILKRIVIIYELFFLRYRKSLLGLFLLLVFATFIGFTENILNQFFVDAIIPNSNYQQFFQYILVYIGINLLCLALSYSAGKLNLSLSQKSAIDIRSYLMSRIHHANLEDITEKHASTYFVRMMEDVAVVTSFYNDAILANLILFLNIGLMFAYIINYYWIILMPVLACAVFQMILNALFSRQLRENQTKIKEVTQNHMEALNNNIFNLSAIKTFNLYSGMLSGYSLILSRIKEMAFKNYRTEFSVGTCITLCGLLSDILVIVIGYNGILNGKLSLGQFLVILAVSSSARGYLSKLMAMNIEIQKFFVSADRLIEIINLESEKQVTKIGGSITKISLENIVFSYTETRRVINNFSGMFTIEKLNVIQGESGSGKSTIVKILTQLYRIDSGRLIVNGFVVDETYDIRERVSVCFQETKFLFNSVYENLKCVGNDITEEEINAALQVVEASDFISQLPKRLNENIGDIERNFSGGELQRIALARTILKKADVYIFDESFGSIDVAMQKRTIPKILRFLKGKMVIIVTHNKEVLSNIDCNTIVVQ